ncbi:hypothetical protein [Bacillus sp. Marseille-P3661]|uniref:hypothetical protein n=1 Tax=Bacillus sp. Marseille-P3661 TaxID=1936234 RepID=UPI000C865C05|nr:hypothetical protein [Bacillus sp. Marseille-P3661]
MQIKSMIENVVKKITDTAQNIITNNEAHLEKHSINELVSFIKEDESTTKTSQTLLGLHFHQYVLCNEEFEFHLETKGKTAEKILYLNIFHKGKSILKYRSYDSKFSLDKNIKIPLQLTH